MARRHAVVRRIGFIATLVAAGLGLASTLATPPARAADNVAALLAKHRAYVGWEMDDGSIRNLVLDGTVVSAPLIAGPIAGGHLEISGNFTRAAVGELAAELQGGPLPVAFRIAGTSTFNQSASS